MRNVKQDETRGKCVVTCVTICREAWRSRDVMVGGDKPHISRVHLKDMALWEWL